MSDFEGYRSDGDDVVVENIRFQSSTNPPQSTPNTKKAVAAKKRNCGRVRNVKNFARNESATQAAASAAASAAPEAPMQIVHISNIGDLAKSLQHAPKETLCERCEKPVELVNAFVSCIACGRYLHPECARVTPGQSFVCHGCMNNYFIVRSFRLEKGYTL